MFIAVRTGLEPVTPPKYHLTITIFLIADAKVDIFLKPTIAFISFF